MQPRLGRLAAMAQWMPGRMLAMLILSVFCTCGVAKLLLYAWVSDDAYITFRVVDNFVHGYGLRWNIAERVQTYTNPLWMLLHIPFYFFWRNIYLLTLVLSIICSAASVAVVIRSFPKAMDVAAFFLIVPLFFMMPWVEFATSGLETPLGYLLFACYGWALIRVRLEKRWFYLAFTAGLAMVNRLDMVFIFIPSMGVLACCEHKLPPFKQLALGFTPLALWLSFSLFYYGFVFPNTKYCKLNADISASEYWMQGLRYCEDLLVTQTWTAVVVLLGLSYGMRCGWRLCHGKPDFAQAGIFSLALGTVIYILYVISAGGDFMSGRFFALPAYIALWMLYAALPRRMPLALGVFLLAYLIVFQQVAQKMSSAFRPCVDCSDWGIVDERNFYLENVLFIPHSFNIRMEPENHLVNIGLQLRAMPKDKPHDTHNIGMAGYYAGPDIFIIDRHALSSPLMSRLPIIQQASWRIGHFWKLIPDGYMHALETGSTEEMDSNLAYYYTKLHLIISGDLGDWKRVKTIIAFNMGRYDHYLKAYNDKPR